MLMRFPPNEYVDGVVGPKSAHRRLYVEAYGPVPSAWHVHHVNRLKYDNRLDNLIALPGTLHKWMHRGMLVYERAVESGSITKPILQRVLIAYLARKFTIRMPLVSYLRVLVQQMGDNAYAPLNSTELDALASGTEAVFKLERETSAKQERARRRCTKARGRQLEAARKTVTRHAPASPYVRRGAKSKPA